MRGHVGEIICKVCGRLPAWNLPDDHLSVGCCAGANDALSVGAQYDDRPAVVVRGEGRKVRAHLGEGDDLRVSGDPEGLEGVRWKKRQPPQGLTISTVAGDEPAMDAGDVFHGGVDGNALL
jgi:hypothetical protein